MNAGPNGAPRFKPEHPVPSFEATSTSSEMAADDCFNPATPRHQCLLVKLRRQAPCCCPVMPFPQGKWETRDVPAPFR